jgi:L-lactate dehydrogenase (cytochrome)
MKVAELRALLAPKPVELRPTARRLARAHNIAELRRAARRVLPAAVFDYVDGGAEDEVSLRRNRAAFDRVELVAGVCRGIAGVDLSVDLLGERIPSPVVLAPTGFTRMVHHDGERAVARGAGRAGTPYVLSTMATCSIEDVAAAATGPTWFQLYLLKDRGLAADLIDRARASGYRQLVFTVDNAAQGARERDLRNGLTIPPALTARTFLDGVVHPGWSYRFLTTDPIEFATVRMAEDDPAVRMRKLAAGFEGTVSWADVEWVQQRWGGPILLKGVQSTEDARQAARLGLAGVVVSNHGGRQLDRSPAPIELLPEIRDAVGRDLAVLVDSGFRRGSDIATAVALGADAVLVGRPYLYGLAAAGAEGVARAVEILHAELTRVLTLLGVASVSQLDGTHLRRRRDVSEANLIGTE